MGGVRTADNSRKRKAKNATKPVYENIFEGSVYVNAIEPEGTLPKPVYPSHLDSAVPNSELVSTGISSTVSTAAVSLCQVDDDLLTPHPADSVEAADTVVCLHSSSVGNSLGAAPDLAAAAHSAAVPMPSTSNYPLQSVCIKSTSANPDSITSFPSSLSGSPPTKLPSVRSPVMTLPYAVAEEKDFKPAFADCVVDDEVVRTVTEL